MKRFIAALALLAGCASAQAADLPLKAKPFDTPVVASTSPFWIGAFTGLGLSPTQNELTIPGAVSGTQKAWPTGILAGVTAGYTNVTGPIAWGISFEAAYDFSRGGVDCSDINAALTGQSCMASRKNGWLFQEGLEFGISLSTLGGYIPTSGQPSNWPVPIVVPASVWSNIMLLGRGGYAERNIDLCAAIDLLGDMGCGSKFIAAPYAGVKLKAMLSTNTELFAVYDHIFWGNGSSFTPTAALPVFQGLDTVTIKQEDLFKVGLAYHL